jgi:hypothetical protein
VLDWSITTVGSGVPTLETVISAIGKCSASQTLDQERLLGDITVQ